MTLRYTSIVNLFKIDTTFLLATCDMAVWVAEVTSVWGEPVSQWGSAVKLPVTGKAGVEHQAFE